MTSSISLSSGSPQADSTYQVVRYQPALKAQVVELQCHLWSPSPALNAAYLEWKYERNPYVGAPLIYLAMHDGKAVGMRGFFGTRWEGEHPAPSAVVLYADDLVIAPQHRNGGLIPRITTAALEDMATSNYQYTVNLSPGPMTVLSSVAAGWRSVGFMQPMRRRPWRVVLRRYRDRLVRRLPALEQLVGASCRSLADISAGRIRRGGRGARQIALEDAPRCAAMAQLVEQIGSGRIRHVRDAAYFAWRFQNPLSRYRFLYYANPQLEGYLVLQEYTSPYAGPDAVNIVDWEATSIAVQAALLRAAIDLTVDRELLVWSVSLSQQLTALLHRSGFKVEPPPASVTEQRHTLLVRPIRATELDGDWHFAGRRLLDLHSWDLRMLYSMHG
jgi:GNAT superfamily N-acetyltransferase